MFFLFLPVFDKCFPMEARDHFRNSAIEFLKGIGSLAECLSSTVASPRPEKRGTRIEVM